MRILFYTTMTFQCRSLLPVMKRLVEQGNKVSILSRGYFSERSIRNRPRAFKDVTRASLRFVCDQIGLDSDFLNRVQFMPACMRLNFPPRRFYQSQEMFISTTKGFKWLNRMVGYGKPRIAVGYQNLLGTYYTKRDELFPDKCPSYLTFEQEFRNTTRVLWEETGLTFLDTYVERYRKARKEKTNKVLLLHPGGYRDVLTKMGESKSESYRKQKVFYESILHSIPPHMHFAVKMHPLAARYHDRKAHEEFAKDLDISIAEGFLGDILFDYDVVLSLGSSAFFEILPFGRPLWILNYFSRERTQLYNELPTFIVESEKELYERLQGNQRLEFVNEFERSFYHRLKKMVDGCSTDRVLEMILRLC